MAKELMSDPALQERKIGKTIKRSDRNSWAESIEELIIEELPYPAIYDITQNQPINFTEYAYTEILGGFWVYSGSLEVTARLLLAASQEKSDISVLDNFEKLLVDKYNLSEVDEKDSSELKNLCILPGTNMLDVASKEQLFKLANTFEDVYFKPHPLTSDDAIKEITKFVGKSKILEKNLSGMALLKSAKCVYSTTASELTIAATILGKKVIDISNPMFENNGAYYNLIRTIYNNTSSVVVARQRLANIINCKYSGVLFPWHTDIEKTRISSFIDKTLAIRKKYKPLTLPILKTPYQKNKEEHMRKQEQIKRQQQVIKK